MADRNKEMIRLIEEYFRSEYDRFLEHYNKKRNKTKKHKNPNLKDVVTNLSGSEKCCPEIVPWVIKQSKRKYILGVTEPSSKFLMCEIESTNQKIGNKALNFEAKYDAIFPNIKKIIKKQHHLHLVLPEKGKTKKINVTYQLTHKSDCKHLMIADSKYEVLELSGDINKLQTVSFEIDSQGHIKGKKIKKKANTKSDKDINLVKERYGFLHAWRSVLKQKEINYDLAYEKIYEKKIQYNDDSIFSKNYKNVFDAIFGVVKAEINYLSNEIGIYNQHQEDMTKISEVISFLQKKIKSDYFIYNVYLKRYDKYVRDGNIYLMAETEKKMNEKFGKVIHLSEKLEIQKDKRDNLSNFKQTSLRSIFVKSMGGIEINNEIKIYPTGVGKCPTVPKVSLFTHDIFKVKGKIFFEIGKKVSLNKRMTTKEVIETQTYKYEKVDEYSTGLDVQYGNKKFKMKFKKDLLPYGERNENKDNKKIVLAKLPKLFQIIQSINKIIPAGTNLGFKFSIDFDIDRADEDNNYGIKPKGSITYSAGATIGFKVDVLTPLISVLSKIPVSKCFAYILSFAAEKANLVVYFEVKGSLTASAINEDVEKDITELKAFGSLKIGFTSRAEVKYKVLSFSFKGGFSAEGLAEFTADYYYAGENNSKNKAELNFEGVTLKGVIYTDLQTASKTQPTTTSGKDRAVIKHGMQLKGQYTFFKPEKKPKKSASTNATLYHTLDGIIA